MGLLDRHGLDGHSTVRAKVVQTRRKHHLQAEIRENVVAGSCVFTDALPSYDGLESDYVHALIDHAESYAEGNIHTNGLENFWSLLKRSIKGTYVSIEPFHLFRYLGEHCFRFNHRKISDAGRFLNVVKSVIGRRLTYNSLIGETC